VEEVRRIAPALTPVIRAWVGREREPSLIALASAIGRRLPLWQELADALENTIVNSAHAYLAASAMGLIVEHLPDRRDRVVTKTLGRDGSWAIRSELLAYLNSRRQDLLTPYLGQKAYAGRFGTGNVRHVLPVFSGFQRWTPTQQDLFADTLAEMAAPPITPDPSQGTGEAIAAIHRLALLPAIGPERLVTLARDSRGAVKEAAIRALGRLDARQGIPELLEALTDERARFAVYALRGVLVDLPPARVMAVMRAAPLAKVTVAKEAVRLAGEFGGDECLGWFTSLAATTLHRDVRGALLRALWDHLERPEAWAILEPVSADPDPGVVIGLSRIPVSRVSTAARERVASLLLRLLGHNEPTVRLAVLERLASQPVPDPTRQLLAASLNALHGVNPDERAAGLRAALSLAGDADSNRFAEAFKGLLPKRKELAEACAAFAVQSQRLGNRLVTLRTEVLAAVERDPTCALLQIRLAAARFAFGPFAEWVARCSSTYDWHIGTLIAVATVVAETSEPVEELARAEVSWAAAVDPDLRWLALRTLLHAASRDGWTPERRNRLAAFCHDASPAVANEAKFVFPPDAASDS
jgi:hypothetical protein